MKGYLEECIRSDTYFIKCPEWDCNAMISNAVIKANLTKKQYKRFKYFRDKN